MEIEEAVILAGGLSRRFGTDKLTYRVGGKEVIVRVSEAVMEVAPRAVLSVRDEGMGERLSRLTGLDFKVDESLPCGGPIRGVLSTVRRDNTLIVPADLPWLSGDVLWSFLRLCPRSSVQICGLLWSSRVRNLEPLIAVIRSIEQLAHVRRACPLKGVRVTDVHRASSSLLLISAGLIPQSWRLLDVDRPQDLNRRGERWKEEMLYISPESLGNPYRRAVSCLEEGDREGAMEMFNLEAGMLGDVENLRIHAERDMMALGVTNGGGD